MDQKVFCPECGGVMTRGSECPHCEGWGLKGPQCSCDCYSTPSGIVTGRVTIVDENCLLHGTGGFPEQDEIPSIMFNDY